MKSILSAGGPYVVVPGSRAKLWSGGAGGDYEAAQRAPDTALVLRWQRGQALVLGTPDALSFHQSDQGGTFVRVVSFDADDDARLEKTVADVEASIWSPIEGALQIDEEQWAFDAALAGSAAGEDERLECRLAAGRYSVSAGTHEDDGVELLLVRLVRV